MRRTPCRRGALVPLGLAALLGVAAAGAQETVDFSRPPNAGLKFNVVSKSSGESESSTSFGEREFSSRQTRSATQTFIQTIVAVKDGKIVKVEREYEDASSKSVMESDRLPEPRETERESPLAWKHLRAVWKQGDDEEEEGGTVEVKEDDEWKAPDRRLKRAVRPRQLRSPLMPLPAEAREVGESWELDSKALRGYFGGGRGMRGRGMRGRRGRRGGEAGQEDESPLEMKAVFKLAEIADYRDLKCAVITMEYTASRGDAMSTKMEATFYYSLAHRIVVGVKGTSTSSVKMSRETQRGSVTMESSGRSKVEAKVEILEAGQPAGQED